MYTVKEAADVLGVSPHTVRYYDDQGLVPGSARDAAGNRAFDDMAMEWLFVAVTLRKTGMPPVETRRYEELYARGAGTVGERLRIMRDQRERLLTQMDELQVSLELLDRKVEHYERLAAGEPDEWSHKYMQDLIERNRKVVHDG